MIAPKDYIEDEVYGQRLLISTKADQRELRSNIRAARAILYSFANLTIIINAGHRATQPRSTNLLEKRKPLVLDQRLCLN